MGLENFVHILRIIYFFPTIRSIRFTSSVDSAFDVSTSFVFEHLKHMSFMVMDMNDAVICLVLHV